MRVTGASAAEVIVAMVVERAWVVCVRRGRCGYAVCGCRDAAS